MILPSVYDEMLECIQKDTFAYFQSQTNHANGLMFDRTEEGAPASIAVVGFAMAAYPYPVADECRFWSQAEAVMLTLTTLRFFWNSPQGIERSAHEYASHHMILI